MAYMLLLYFCCIKFLGTIKNATNNDIEIIKKLQHSFNKATSTYRVSSELILLMQTLTKEIKENNNSVHKSLTKLFDKLQANSNKFDKYPLLYATLLQSKKNDHSSNYEADRIHILDKNSHDEKQFKKKRFNLTHIVQDKEVTTSNKSSTASSKTDAQDHNSRAMCECTKNLYCPGQVDEASATFEAITTFTKQSKLKKHEKQIRRLEHLLTVRNFVLKISLKIQFLFILRLCSHQFYFKFADLAVKGTI